MLARLALAAAMVAAVSAAPLTLLKAREKHLHATRQAARHVAARGALPADQWFPQLLDHFDVNPETASQTWQQRYWVNASFWQGASSGAPVFVYVEGEGAGSPVDVVLGEHVELAASYGALVVALEHRFYGASQPTGDWSTSSLALLSSHQALQDLAVFITGYLVPTYGLNLGAGPDGTTNPNAPINRLVTFGGSYPGALSAWARLRLPHLVHTAVSSSSPVEAQLDFQGYNNVVAASLSLPSVGGSPQCLQAVTAAFEAIDAAFAGTPAQRDAMAAQLQSCAPLTGPNDTFWAASNYAGSVMGVVQYNAEVPGPTIASLCQQMLTAATPIAGFAAFVNASQGGVCMDNSYADFVQQFGNSTAQLDGTGVGIRQWTWQTCTQFAYYQTCDPSTACPFSALMTLAGSTQQCADLFGPAYTAAVNAQRVDATNAAYGGKAVASSASRIIFVNGQVDPWHALSAEVSPDPLACPSVIVPNGAHCNNMMPSSPADPPALVKAREQVAALLATFLSQ